MRTIIMLLVVCASVLSTTTSLTAGNEMNSIHTIESHMLNQDMILLVQDNFEKGASTLQAYHLQNSHKVWELDVQSMIDLHILHHPDKIVILSIQEGYIVKTVYDFEGKLLHSDNYGKKLKIQQSDVHTKIAQWIAPRPNVNERIATLQDDNFMLYQYPWNQPILTKSISYTDDRYEYVSVEDWEFYGYPYLVVQYHASGMFNTDHILRHMNLYTKADSTQLLPMEHVSMQGISGRAIVHTNYSQSSGPVIDVPDHSEPQMVLQSYSMTTGKLLSHISAPFTTGEQDYGWKTEIAGDALYVEDIGAGTWILYDFEGQPISQPQDMIEHSKFIGISADYRTAYFASVDAGRLMIQSVTL